MPAIGFIGLGNMGAPMAANLVKSGEHVLGFDVVPAARQAAAGDGVQIVANARSTVEDAEVVITMLPAGEHVLSVWNDIVPRRAAGHAVHRLLDDRRRERAQGARAGGGARHRHARCAGLGRRRRRQGGDAHLHGRRLGARLRARQADPRAHGQAHRALRRCRQRPGGEDLQQYDSRRFDDRGQRSVRARRKARPVASGAVRRRLGELGPVLVADELLPGARAGAGEPGE